jgi:arsenate reductase (thioredoxin)
MITFGQNSNESTATDPSRARRDSLCPSGAAARFSRAQDTGSPRALHSAGSLNRSHCFTAVLGGRRRPRWGTPPSKTPIILFICEHGAAKSVIAAAYFDKLAKERGLNYRAVFRGTNPDAVLAVAAEKGLKEDGIDTRGWKPEIVTKKDLAAASAVVTLGCALPGKEVVASKVVEWNGVPSVSENYQAARGDIVKRVQGLVDDLAKKEQAAKGQTKEKP